MSLLVVHHVIYRIQRIPRIYHFVCSLKVITVVKNGTVRPTSGLHILLEALPIWFMYIRKGLKQVNSSGCLLAHYRIPFVLQRGYLKSSILCVIWEKAAIDNGTVQPISGWHMLLWAPPIWLMQIEDAWNIPWARNVSPMASHLSYWEGTQNLAFCVKFESWI